MLTTKCYPSTGGWEANGQNFHFEPTRPLMHLRARVCFYWLNSRQKRRLWWNSGEREPFHRVSFFSDSCVHNRVIPFFPISTLSFYHRCLLHSWWPQSPGSPHSPPFSPSLVSISSLFPLPSVHPRGSTSSLGGKVKRDPFRWSE